jgi:uncharacterized membrane protein
MSDKEIILAIYAGGGIFLILISLPLLAGKIPPNLLYGFRVPKTLNNPQIWYEINRYAARWLILTGVVTSIAALAIYAIFPDMSLDAYALACLAVFSLVLIYGVSQSFLKLRSMN